MSEVDQEIEAIKSVLSALEPLQPDVRKNVLEYVLKRLNISVSKSSSGSAQEIPEDDLEIPATPAVATGRSRGATHIKALKEQKNPKSANEMAALVAYYLSEVAPAAERKDTITSNDIKTYFKIADFPLPKVLRMTLGNAKSAGYLDSTGDNEYKLNPVGYNLVVHNLPRNGSVARSVSHRSRKKKAPAKKPE